LGPLPCILDSLLDQKEMIEHQSSLIDACKGYLIEKPTPQPIMVKPKLLDNDSNTAYYQHYFYQKGKCQKGY
jgi:hypothetical protein